MTHEPLNLIEHLPICLSAQGVAYLPFGCSTKNIPICGEDDLGLRISTNLVGMTANRNLGNTTNERERTLERLSSGNRIVRSGDDAAGLSISDKLRAGIRSMQMAERNTQDGLSLIQTAEGGIIEAQNMVTRLRELSMQAASDTVGDAERSFTNVEFQHLKSEIQRIANTTEYNRTPLLNGLGQTLDFQIGIENANGIDRVSYSSSEANILPSALGIAGARIDTKESARNNLPSLDSALSKLSENRAYLGAVQSQLTSHIQNVGQHRTNLAQGNSRLRDADFAEWSAKDVSASVQQQAANSVLAQSNNFGKSALVLLEKI